VYCDTTAIVGNTLQLNSTKVQTCIPSSVEARDASLLGAGSLGPGVAAWQGLLTELLLTFLLTIGSVLN